MAAPSKQAAGAVFVIEEPAFALDAAAVAGERAI
jgi:hypothetical protein